MMSRFLKVALVAALSISGVVAQQCGPTNGNAVCAVGECCSQYGWCDVSAAHCAPGCQPAFSGAGSACSGSPTPTSTLSTVTSTGGPTSFPSYIPEIDICGAGTENGMTCPGVGEGGYYYRCCSSVGHCGPKNLDQDQEQYCGTGCQPLYGRCDVSRPKPPAPPAPAPQNTFPNGECGVIVNTRCAEGECCSGSNFCGVGEDYCGAANWCQHGYGICW